MSFHVVRDYPISGKNWRAIFESGYFWASVIILLFISLIAIDINENNIWKEFVKNHKCHIVGHMDGEFVTGVGVGAKGPVTTVSCTSDKEGWLCDDGVTYWR